LYSWRCGGVPRVPARRWWRAAWTRVDGRPDPRGCTYSRPVCEVRYRFGIEWVSSIPFGWIMTVQNLLSPSMNPVITVLRRPPAVPRAWTNAAAALVVALAMLVALPASGAPSRPDPRVIESLLTRGGAELRPVDPA